MVLDVFQQALEEWVVHCEDPRVQLSSSPDAVTDCHAYRTIVSLGYQALPIIRQLYEVERFDVFPLSLIKGHGLVAAVRDIVGDGFSIPEEMQGRVSALEDYTKRWLDEHMVEYLLPPSSR